jgi:hypothetical protein
MATSPNRLTELSPLIIEEIQKVTRHKKEQKFLIELLQYELAYYAYDDPNGDRYKKDYKFLLDTYFPFSDNNDSGD